MWDSPCFPMRFRLANTPHLSTSCLCSPCPGYGAGTRPFDAESVENDHFSSMLHTVFVCLKLLSAGMRAAGVASREGVFD